MKTTPFFRIVCIMFVGVCALVQTDTIRTTFAQDHKDSPAFSVDFTQKVGPVKQVNGVNCWIPFHSGSSPEFQQKAEACRFSTVRLHDVPLTTHGMRLVDVHLIFGNPDADPADPRNYYFEQTDDYIKSILDAGAVPIYRLGTSIEHSANKYFARNPKDAAKYAEICAAIVRHYNAGWADGHDWNLPYWEIWNEPNLIPQMWDDKNWDSYCKFYVVVAKRLRQEFPNIKIGGPALTHADCNMIKQLADLCKQEGAPLDFVSWHCYPQTPEQLVDPPFEVRKTLDEAGFPNAELHLNEWHYLPCGWKGVQGSVEDKVYWVVNAPEGLNGYVSAAFNTFVMTRWQDGPLTMANFYSYSGTNWGLVDPYGQYRTPYYTMAMFGELASQTPIRVMAKDDDNVALLAGIDESGKTKRLLVSIFQRDETNPIEIKLAGVPESGEVSVDIVDFDHSFLETKIQYQNSVLRLDSKDSGVYFIRF